jgi:hypothetical protein
MEVKQIKTLQDVETYVNGIVNDFETGEATKTETVTFILELIGFIGKKYEERQKDEFQKGIEHAKKKYKFKE